MDNSYDLINPDMHAKPTVCRKTKKVFIQFLAIMTSCKELSVWNHVWFLDMVAKKGQPG